MMPTAQNTINSIYSKENQLKKKDLNENKNFSTDYSKNGTLLSKEMSNKKKYDQKILNDILNNNLPDYSYDMVNQSLNNKKINELNEINLNKNDNSNSNNLSKKKKKKKFLSNKSQDSSSSNSSLISASNDSQFKKDELYKNWKFSKTHQKRFHRRFPHIEPNEQLIDWFSCALLTDILLQGYLYISENYFAFYSNIFGYKTHVLIKISDVFLISKEKTAKIFPNAVGIKTKTDKFVFGSLLSRESTFKLLNQVCDAYQSLKQEKLNNTNIIEPEDDKELKLNSLEIQNIEKDDKNFDKLNDDNLISTPIKIIENTQEINEQITNQIEVLDENNLSQTKTNSNNFSVYNIFDYKGSKSFFLLTSICFLLFVLLISIFVLIHRVDKAHSKLNSISNFSNSLTELILSKKMFNMSENFKFSLN